MAHFVCEMFLVKERYTAELFENGLKAILEDLTTTLSVLWAIIYGQLTLVFILFSIIILYFASKFEVRQEDNNDS